jgi:hypothetical protein
MSEAAVKIIFRLSCSTVSSTLQKPLSSLIWPHQEGGQIAKPSQNRLQHPPNGPRQQIQAPSCCWLVHIQETVPMTSITSFLQIHTSYAAYKEFQD